MRFSAIPFPRFNRQFAFVSALMVLAIGLLIGIFSETSYRAQKLRELEVQAAILSESVTAPLMFSDATATGDYTKALATNPQVESAYVFGRSGDLLASFQRNPNQSPPEKPHIQPASFQGEYAEIAKPAQRDGQTYGIVYLRLRTDSLLTRVIRYAPIALLIVMAALVLFVAGAAQGDLARANSELQSRAEALAETNQMLSREIEQRKEAEEALLQSRKMEAIGQLTGGVAHDFNNLLMVISGGLRLLEKQSEERQRKTKEAMTQAVERGAGLTRQLLAFARRQTQHLEVIDVERQINGMRELLERSLRADILLDMALPADLPPIKVDPGEFELAILNLAVNARDAMPKGGVITLSAAATPEPNRRVEISLRDTGTGIAPEIIDRIFEPYFTTKQIGQGTGLGLSQVYGFTKQNGGDIRIDSEVGTGTVITLSFPASAEAPAKPNVVRMDRESGVVDTRRVLMVEDDDTVGDTVFAMLSELGHNVTRSRSVDEALQMLARAEPFDLVFSDIFMPGGRSGIDLAQELETSMPDLPVLLTSGYTGTESAALKRPLLRKPYQLDELREAIRALPRRRA
jgi:signal transduction histidine kinase